MKSSDKPVPSLHHSRIFATAWFLKSQGLELEVRRDESLYVETQK
jgi:hypothetical protein